MHRDTSITPAERAAIKRVSTLGIDTRSMSAISNVFRVSNSLRNFSEQTLLKEFGLSFSGFTVLWVLWIWGPKESHVLAAESGIAKSTLTGVMKTLQSLGFASKMAHSSDRRRVVVTITPSGARIMKKIFPRFNQIEVNATANLTKGEKTDLAHALRVILHTVERQISGPNP